MKFKFKVILYFGFAGVLVSIFLTLLRLVKSEHDESFLTICGNFFQNAIVAYVVTVIISAAVMYTLVKINQIFPWKENAFIRFGADFVITPIVATLTMLPLAILTHRLGIEHSHESMREHVINEMVTALVVDLIMVGIYEGYLFFNLWKSSLIKNEQLQKENAMAKYEALKNQVNPHFLFNSLNTASALVHEDPDKAEEFIDEFSKIYRFLLEHQDKNLHLLKDEIAFVESFLALQKIRFGESLKTTIEVNENMYDLMIPTLSLQLLVENAIKHNQVTKKRPLHISIGNDGEYLEVKNTLQRRNEPLNSTGIGLNNLNARYEMLSDLKPRFSETDDSYIAKLPLIKEE